MQTKYSTVPYAASTPNELMLYWEMPLSTKNNDDEMLIALVIVTYLNSHSSIRHTADTGKNPTTTTSIWWNEMNRYIKNKLCSFNGQTSFVILGRLFAAEVLFFFCQNCNLKFKQKKNKFSFGLSFFCVSVRQPPKWYSVLLLLFDFAHGALQYLF